MHCGLCYSKDCKTCIIVGNGGILSNKSLGQKIDEFDVVVRYVLICFSTKLCFDFSPN